MSAKRIRKAWMVCLVVGVWGLWVFAADAERPGGPETVYRGFPISLNLRDADVVTVLHLLAEEARINLVIADDVRGKVDVHLVNVPWDQALDEILRSRDLVKRKVGNVLQVSTMEGLKRELELKELLRGDERRSLEAQQKAREVFLKIKEDEEMAKPLLARTFSVRYAKAAELQKNLLPSLSRDAKAQPRGSIEVNEFSNTLVVRDTAASLDQIAAILSELDRPIPLILIEARIVEVNTDVVRDLGIQWGANTVSPTSRDRVGGAGGFSLSSTTGDVVAGVADRAFAVNFPAALIPGGPGLGFGFALGSLLKNFSLDVQLTALETQGQAHILSRPKIVATDNFEALIKRGEDIPYIVTKELGAAPDVQFKEANLQLKVRPHVIKDGRIILDINIRNDARTIDNTTSATSEFPIIARQEATTRALVPDGDTLVIGGIIQQRRTRSESGVPFLKDVPGLSWIFGRKGKTETTRELLIFITPRVMEEEGA
jgi:type IV pilus assembly protein PilQ